VPVLGTHQQSLNFLEMGGCITDEVTYATFNAGMFGAMVQ